jgi:sigma-B regulation protein RsbU (phosphoserine phosphatase)
VLRRDGRAEWLDATGFVLGMFEEWSGTARTVDLTPGDTFVIYTDGVSEAPDQNDNEFGTAEMVSICKDARDAETLLNTLVGAVREFSGDRQHDDITIVTGRVKD